MSSSFHAIVSAAFAALIALGPAAARSQPEAHPVFVESPATRQTLKDLNSGGFVLYMRHGNTDNSRPDRVPQVDLDDCSTQRVLSGQGRELAVRVGKAIQSSRIPISEVIHSPMCRARDTARLAFGHLGDRMREERHLMYASNLTTEAKKPVIEMTRRLLSTPVAPGTNRVVVAHAPNMAELNGYYVKPEGTVVVIRPLGQGAFEYVSSIRPAMWPELLK